MEGVFLIRSALPEVPDLRISFLGPGINGGSGMPIELATVRSSSPSTTVTV